MTEVKIEVIGAHAKMAEKIGRLTTGMVGAVARFSFDGVWDGLTKVAVFNGSGVTRDVLQWDGDAVKIPPEALREAGRLYVGVEGRNGDGSVVIPTVWVDCGMVLCGANASGDPSTEPGLAVWQQIQSAMGDLALLQTKAKESLVAAINEVLASSGASVDEATVERIVEAYLSENPPEGGTVDPEAVGQIVEAYLQEHPVETDKDLLTEGAPADAYVTGKNIRNIGKTLKAVQKRAYAQGEFISIRDTVLDIVGDQITLNDGYIYAPDGRIDITEKVTITRDTQSNVCQLVYDKEDKAVRCISGWATLEDDQILIAVISKLYPGSVNANHIPGKWTVDGALYPRPEAPFGLNWYALGDSITRGMYGHPGGAGVDTANCWAALAARYNGWSLTNMGVSGSGYLAKGGSAPETDAREQVDAFDFAGAELVTLAYGVNDWMQDHEVGSMEDDVAVGGTFISNMRYCIEKIMADEPASKIVVISPINCRVGSTEATNWGMGRVNGAGATLDDFFRAEQTVCEHYGIEFIDMLHGSVVNRLNIVAALPDGVHPTLEIHEQMAKELSRKIMSGGGSDAVDSYSRAQIDAALGAYITDIDTLIGGEN